MADDKALLKWLRTDLAAALEHHGALASRAWHDPANKAAEQAKADMANTVLRRLDAYEAGQPPIRPKDNGPPTQNAAPVKERRNGFNTRTERSYIQQDTPP